MRRKHSLRRMGAANAASKMMIIVDSTLILLYDRTLECCVDVPVEVRTVVGGPVGGEVGSFVGGPVGGEVGSFVGGPVGGEVGSRLTTLERAKRNVRVVIALSLTESQQELYVGVLNSMQTEWRKDEHDVHTRVIDDFEAAVVSSPSKQQQHKETKQLKWWEMRDHVDTQCPLNEY